MKKKQLLIVPPMSEPLQKLYEVLQGIVNDENIEISIVDDLNELKQFMGSSGQCLVTFANAKKCATFLQENRFVIAKSHSKVILLTPREIPNKTLDKFIKIGLTESILENSPPKTLLYKVKLLLRSIKTTPQQEEKDQVIKSKYDTAPLAANQAGLEAEKSEGDEASVNYLGEERAKFKAAQEENTIDYGENLKGKTTAQEEAIETHWKSKRKKDESTPANELESKKVENQDSSEIDMYYRGKNKKKSSEQLGEDDDLYGKKRSNSDLPEEEESLKKKRKPETFLDLEAAAPLARKKYQEEEDDLFHKPKKTAELMEEEEKPKLQKLITEEEKAENRKKELEELDALFAKAMKRKTAEQAEDLGGHLKGKILNNIEESEEDAIKEKKEYDNSELYGRNKSIELELIAAKEEQRRRKDNGVDEDEKAPHDGQVDRIDNNNMLGENGSTDKISTLMMSELGKDHSKKGHPPNSLDLDSKKKSESNEESLVEKTKKLDPIENSELDYSSEKKLADIDQNSIDDKEKFSKINLESAIDEQNKKETKKEESESDGRNRKSTTLQLLDEDEDEENSAKPEKVSEEDLPISLRKLEQTDLDLEKKKEEKKNHGKVDKIDTYYRGGESKKTEYSWDNLDNKNRDINIQLEKGKRNADETAARQLAKDYGEITIDYRKLKEEFEEISRNGKSSGESGISEERSLRLLDSEDEGTFKVIEFDPRGFDFGINIINLIFQKDSKAVDVYKTVAEELITKYKAYPVFYTFKLSDNKHSDAFDSFMHFSTTLVSNELKEWWLNTKTQNEIMNDYFSKTMTTWLCREIEDKSGTTGKYWEDVELPQWAANELTTKKVELIFPYFDGIDRMGVAIVFMPFGLNPKIEKGLTVTLEMARTVLLDSIQRKSAPVERDSGEEVPVEKKKILSMFSGLFNRNKAG